VTVCVWGGEGGQIWSPLERGVEDGADRVASRAGGGGGGGAGRVYRVTASRGELGFYMCSTRARCF